MNSYIDGLFIIVGIYINLNVNKGKKFDND